jgi:glutathione S-transferase
VEQPVPTCVTTKGDKESEEAAMLELYQFEECKYSTKVRLKMSEWQIDCLLRNVSQAKSKRQRLKKISGQTKVPTLVDSLRNVVIAGDEIKIIDYLGKHYRLKGQR